MIMIALRAVLWILKVIGTGLAAYAMLALGAILAVGPLLLIFAVMPEDLRGPIFWGLIGILIALALFGGKE